MINKQSKRYEKHLITQYRNSKRGATPPSKLPTWRLSEPMTSPRPLFNSPSEFWEAATEYFEWCRANPLEVEVTIAFNGRGHRHMEKKPRPFTMRALATFLGVTIGELDKLKGEGPKWSRVVEMADQSIYTQKFEYAAIGVYNASMISKDLGLVDKQEVKSGVTVTFAGKDEDL